MTKLLALFYFIFLKDEVLYNNKRKQSTIFFMPKNRMYDPIDVREIGTK